ncbi:hypothetical protein HIM_08411 [Hirsutella minnesotensis 3608]|uniref:Protein PLANT CADMIUM RESISTANCE 3 n=1 Tax=Hirsutella minnesotensis 3608 TaxID=1043627 RepID=A0A0F7ZH74_9HYPO|nr:hypothetical protein HIM_08411 [Hirsutella minnesotensis 3608]
MGSPATKESGGSHDKWQSGLCECSPISSCCLSCFLPCVLHGRTHTRMRDPSMQTHSAINGECVLFGAIHCFTGLGCLFNFIRRMEIRKQYEIRGTGVSDCCVSFWCHCCALIQQDNEVKLRTAGGGPVMQQYRAQTEGMQMPGPG